MLEIIIQTLQLYSNLGKTRIRVWNIIELTKQNIEGEEEIQEVYFHSSNRRVLNMKEFDTVYGQAMNKITQDFET